MKNTLVKRFPCGCIGIQTTDWAPFGESRPNSERCEAIILSSCNGDNQGEPSFYGETLAERNTQPDHPLSGDGVLLTDEELGDLFSRFSQTFYQARQYREVSSFFKALVNEDRGK